MSITRVLAAGVVAAGACASLVAPASAESVTTCNGKVDGGVTRVVEVPADATCDVSNVTIEGNVRIAKGGNFIAKNATIVGSITVADGGFVDFVGGRVDGSIVSADSYGVSLQEVRVAGQVKITGAANNPFLFTDRGVSLTNVTVTNGQAALQKSTVTGSLLATAGDYADVYNSTVWGQLLVRGQRNGTVVCDSTARSAAVLSDNGGVQVGPGAKGVCEGDFSAGQLIISGTKGATTVANARVANILTGFGNDPAPVIGDGVLAGKRGGQFVAPKPTTPAPTAAPVDNALLPSVSRVAELQARRDARVKDAAAAAAAAGVVVFG